MRDNASVLFASCRGLTVTGYRILYEQVDWTIFMTLGCFLDTAPPTSYANATFRCRHSVAMVQQMIVYLGTGLSMTICVYTLYNYLSVPIQYANVVDLLDVD